MSAYLLKRTTLRTCITASAYSSKTQNSVQESLYLFSSFQMSKENFRFYIKVRTALDVQARVIHDELYSVYGDQAPGLSTVERWSKLFREGREEL